MFVITSYSIHYTKLYEIKLTMKKLLILLVITIFMFNGCTDEETCDCVPPPECDKAVIVDGNKYDNAPDDDLNITDAKIVNDCLTITFGSSGCDGSSWQLALYDAGVIMESYPPQRNIRLSLKNEELCDAYFSYNFV